MAECPDQINQKHTTETPFPPRPERRGFSCED